MAVQDEIVGTFEIDDTKDELIGSFELPETPKSSETYLSAPVEKSLLEKSRPLVDAAVGIAMPSAQPFLKENPYTLWERAKKVFSDPEKEGSKATLALVDADTFGIRPSEAYKYRDVIDKGVKINPQAAALQSTMHDRARQAWEIGLKQNDIGEIGYKFVLTGDPKYLEQIRSIGMPTEEETFISESKIEDAIRSAAKILPMSISTGIEASKSGIKMGTGFGLIAALAGQAGPQVAVPEELITVPAATLAGFKIGSVSKAYEVTLRKEAGLALSEIINLKDAEGNEIDPNIARAASFGIGAINAALEVEGFKILLKSIPGADKLFSEAIEEAVLSKTVRDRLKDLAVGYGAVVGKESLIEGAQESSNVVFEAIAKAIQNKTFGTDIKQDDVDTILNRLGSTMKEAALGFSVIALPGTIMKAGMINTGGQEIQNIEDIPQEVMDTFVDVQEKMPEALVIGTIEDNEGNITGYTMADSQTGNTFEVGPSPTELEIKTGVDSVREGFQGVTEQDIDRIINVPETDLETEIDSIINRVYGEQEGLRAQEFYNQISEVVPKEEADAVSTILDARAKSAGITTDEYIESRGIEVVISDEATEGDFIPGGLAQIEEKIISSIENEFSEYGLKYDGMFDRTALNKEPLFQFTPQSGEFKGRTIAVEELSNDAVQNKLNTLRQETKASVTFEETRTIIRAFEKADVSSLVHELGHVFRRDIGGEELTTVEQWAGVKDGKWTVEAEEKFARGFERYLATGKAPTAELTTVFERFKNWLTEIYNNIKGSSIDVKISSEMQRVFDGLLTEREGAVTLKQEAETKTDTPEFKEWFGDSKVVDENGEPVVVFHGTPDSRFIKEDGTFKAEIERFGAGKKIGVHWFTGSKKAAETYADIKRAFDYQNAEPDIIPAYLSMENPLVIDGGGKNWRDVQKRGRTSSVIDQAIENGNDGIIIKNVKDDYNNTAKTQAIDTYAVFDSTKIKSVYNIGTFGREEKNIFKQKAEPVKTTIRRETGQARGLEPKTISEREALKASFIKAAQAARKALSEGKKEGVAKEKARLREIINKATARRAKSKTVASIKAKIKRELKFSKVKKQSGKPVGKFTPEIQDILNKLISVSKLSTEEANQKLVDNLLRYDNELPPQDVVIENHLLETIARWETMDDPKQLQSVLDEIVALKNEGRLIKNLKDFNRSSKNIARVENTIDELGGIPAGVTIIGKKDFLPKTRSAKAKQALKSFGKSMMGWDDLMDILSSKSDTKPGESFISKDNDLLGFKNKEKRGIRKSMDSVNNSYKKAYGLETGRQVLNKISEDNAIEITLKKVKMTDPIDGSDFETDLVFTRSELRKRAMELMDPSLEESFKEMGYNESTKAAIFNELTGRDKDFIKRQMEFYNKYYDSVNSVYKAMYGVNLPKNDFYTPISREGISKPTDASIGEFMQEISFRAAATSGSLKTRVGSTLTVSKQSDVSVLERHISEMEHFKAWAEKIRDLNAVWKDPQVRTSVEINHGSDMLAMVDSFISDIANGSPKTSQKLKGLDRLRINFTKAALAVQPDILIKQLTSFVAYAEKMPIGAFTKNMALFWTDPVKHYKEIISSELMKERGKNIDRDLKQAMNSKEHSAFTKTKSLADMLMLNVQVGDRGAIIIGGWPYYKWLKDSGMSHEEAINKFEKFTEQTQQSGDITEQSYWQRGGSLAKLMTMFSSSPNQYFRKEIGAVRNLVSGRQGVKQTLKTLAIYHIVLPMLFQLASDRFTWDEEEQKRALIFGSLNGWFIMGDGLEFILRKALGMQTFNMEMPIYSIFHDFIKATDIVNFMDLSADEFFRAIRGVSGVVGSLTGLPFKQTVDTIKGAGDVLSGEYEKGLTEMMGYSPYLAEKITKE